ncbi:MAG: hypothetical protein ACRESP_16890, partial [Pseudomonas sp.]
TELEKLRHDSTLTVTLKVAFDDLSNEATARVFPELTVRLLKPADLVLPVPAVVGAVNGEYDPINALEGATVRVTYDGMLVSDSLIVSWLGDDVADSFETAAKPGSEAGTVDFLIPVSVVAASQNKTVQVSYYVVASGGTPVWSQPLALPVKLLTAGQLRAPSIRDAANGALDLTKFSGNTKVLVEAWPLIAVGQRYWIMVDSTLENGTPHNFYVAQNNLVTPGQVGAGVDEELLRSELQKLQHNANLSVTLRVAFDGAADEGKARVFPVLSVKLLKLPDLALPAPVVPQASGNRLQASAVPAGGLQVRVNYTGMVVGDKVKVMFASHTTAEQTVATVTALNFTVPKAVVDANAHSTIDVFYQVVRGTGGPALASAKLGLRIDMTSMEQSFEAYPIRTVPQGQSYT